MAQVVPAEFRDMGAVEQMRPRGLESGFHFKDASPTVGLFAPTIEQTAVNRRATMTIDRRPRLTTPQWPNILIVPTLLQNKPDPL
jgi:hypothetical protein